jgi:hypothetical protein
MAKPKVTTNAVANLYAGPTERIIEFSSEKGGGLISLQVVGDELRLYVYQQDKTVQVTVGEPRES